MMARGSHLLLVSRGFEGDDIGCVCVCVFVCVKVSAAAVRRAQSGGATTRQPRVQRRHQRSGRQLPAPGGCALTERRRCGMEPTPLHSLSLSLTQALTDLPRLLSLSLSLSLSPL